MTERIALFLLLYLAGLAAMTGAAWLTVTFGQCPASLMYPVAILMWTLYSIIRLALYRVSY